MATVTLGDLAAGARQLANMEVVTLVEGAGFITPAQWRLWVNEGIQELHGLVSTAYGDSFFTQLLFTLASTANGEYTLPADFMRMRGLDLNPGTPRRQTIHRFNFGERNGESWAHWPFGGGQRLTYRVVSRTKMIIEPIEAAAGNYKIYYVSRAVCPSTASTSAWDATSLQDELQPFYEYVQIVAAIKGLAKQNGDVTPLIERRNVMRQDINDSAPTDENEAQTITDVQDGWWGSSGAGSGGGGGGLGGLGGGGGGHVDLRVDMEHAWSPDDTCGGVKWP